MTFEAIVSFIVSQLVIYLAIYTGLFYAVLTWLGVKEKRISRGLFLAGVLVLAQVAASFAVVLPNQVTVQLVLGTTVFFAVFYLVTRKLLVLKAWQYVVIPLSVTVVGFTIHRIILIFYYTAVSVNT